MGDDRPPVVSLTSSSVGGDLVVLQGLAAAPPSLRAVIARFVELYLGTEEAPVPFGGRSDELRALTAWVADGSVGDGLDGPPGTRNLLVTAPAGRGKSALLVRWIAGLGPELPVVFVPISIRYQTNQASVFYRALAVGLASIIGESMAEPLADPAAYYRERCVEYLGRLDHDGTDCVVVIDGLDEARGWSLDPAVLVRRADSTVRMVVSARELAGDRGPADWAHRLGWTGHGHRPATLPVRPLTRSGIAEALTSMGFPLADLSRHVDIVDELFRLTEGGDPLLMYLYIDDLVANREEAARLRPVDLRALEPGFGPYFRRWLDEQEAEWREAGEDVDHGLVEVILAVLASALGPLKLGELAEVVERLGSAPATFSTRTMAPLRRFVVGDGTRIGYALAHPRLARYLQEEHFAGQTIERAQDVIVRWLEEAVRQVERGDLRPTDLPEYGLLFYSQHLMLLPVTDAAPRFRALMDEGWRRGWEAYEGGTEGYARDISRAVRAIRDAAATRPDGWRAPRTGLGGYVRGLLCLASVRSIGSGMGPEVLDTMLRHQLITPQRALHLARQRGGEGFLSALRSIISHLPSPQLEAAYDAVTDVRDPASRARLRALIAIHLGTATPASWAERVLADIALVRQDRRRSLVSELLVAVDDPAMREQLEALVDAEPDPPTGPDEVPIPPRPPGRPPTMREMQASSDWRDLVARARQPGLSPAEAFRVLSQARSMATDDDSFRLRTVIDALAARLDPDGLALAVDLAIAHPDVTVAVLPSLLPRLPDDLLGRVSDHVRESWPRGAPFLAAEMASRIGVESALDLALEHGAEAMRQTVHRLAGRATAEEAAILAARLADRPDGLAALALEHPAVVADHHAHLLATVTEVRVAALLKAIVPVLDAALLPVALEKARTISDEAERGRVLLALLPRLRSEGPAELYEDALGLVFVIGDHSARWFALAALDPRHATLDERVLIREIVARLRQPTPPKRRPTSLDDGGRDDEDDRMVSWMALVVAASDRPVTERLALAEELLPLVRGGSEEMVATAAALLLALDLPPGSDVVDELHAQLACVDPEHLLLVALISAPEHALPAVDAAEEAKAEDTAVIEAVRSFLRGSGATGFDGLLEEADPDASPEMLSAMRDILGALSLVSIDDPRTLAARVVELRTLIDDPMAVALLLASCASYVDDGLLELGLAALDAAADSSRSTVLGVLGGLQGAMIKILRAKPLLASELLQPSALVRMGGDHVLAEIADAVDDVSRWWP